MISLSLLCSLFFFFFFQAEDGIRDDLVTGVQTCALPISAGLRVGVHMTPYLQSPLEKLAVGERLATPEEFVELVAWIRSRLEALEGDDPDFAPRYGSAWVALTFEFFRRRQVDLTVLEAGAGGRFDLTNVVFPAVAAVTSVGKDHLPSPR